MERKLAAILSADVKGYSRLMGEDEEATIRTLVAYRQVMTTLIQQHRGRVVDSPGDNLLAEFASVVDAVRCAVENQRKTKAMQSLDDVYANLPFAELPKGRRYSLVHEGKLTHAYSVGDSTNAFLLLLGDLLAEVDLSKLQLCVVCRSFFYKVKR